MTPENGMPLDLTAQRWREHESRHEREQQVLEAAALRLAKDIADAKKDVLYLADVHATAHSREHESHQTTHEVERLTGQEKAAMMSEKLQGMNEFRDQLREQAGTFIRRSEAESQIDALEKQFLEYKDSHATFVTNELSRIATEIAQFRSSVETRFATIEGQQKGSQVTKASIYTAIAGAAAVLTIVVIIVNYAFE